MVTGNDPGGGIQKMQGEGPATPVRGRGKGKPPRRGRAGGMNFARLHLLGSEAALHEIHRRLACELDVVWLAGEVRRGELGRHRQSFLTKGLAEGDNPPEMIAKLATQLRRWRRKGVSFRIPGLRATISCGVGVGTREQFIPCVQLAKADLELLVELGLEFELTSYPVSDGP